LISQHVLNTEPGVFEIRYVDADASARRDAMASAEESDDAEEEEYEDPDAFREDFEIRLAQQLLISAKDTWEREAFLAAVKPELDQSVAKETKALEKELKKYG